MSSISVASSGSASPPFSVRVERHSPLLLVAPGVELLADAEQAVVEEQHDAAASAAPMIRIARRSEVDQHVVAERSPRSACRATAPSARPMPPMVSIASPSSTVSKPKIEIGDAAVLRGIEAADEAERHRGDEEDGDARALVVDADAAAKASRFSGAMRSTRPSRLPLMKRKRNSAADHQREARRSSRPSTGSSGDQS